MPVIGPVARFVGLTSSGSRQAAAVGLVSRRHGYSVGVGGWQGLQPVQCDVIMAVTDRPITAAVWSSLKDGPVSHWTE